MNLKNKLGQGSSREEEGAGGMEEGREPQTCEGLRIGKGGNLGKGKVA